MARSFDEWMIAVDKTIERAAGVSVHDLADVSFQDFYEDGMTPREVAVIILTEEGFYS